MSEVAIQGMKMIPIPTFRKCPHCDEFLWKDCQGNNECPNPICPGKLVDALLKGIEKEDKSRVDEA